MAEEPGQENRGASSEGKPRLGRLIGIAIVAAILLVVLLWVWVQPSDPTEKKDFIQAVGVLLAGLAGFGGLYFTWTNLNQTRQTTQRTLELTEQGQITERFTRAIDQLGATDDKANKLYETRLGGIYALERIAIEAVHVYHWPIMRVLTAYLRQDTSSQGNGLNEPQADIQAIVGVIGRRAHNVEVGKDEHIGLFGVDLSRYDLNKAHLERADLRGSHFESAGLNNAQLKGADLRGAHFGGAYLKCANLCEADLRGANLEGAYLVGADFGKAKLGEANLSRSALRRADLREVIGLTPGMLGCANGDQTTRLPDGCQAPDWWSRLPEEEASLCPQEYSIKVCKVPLRFSGDANWRTRLSLPNTLYVTPEAISFVGRMFSFNHIQCVCDPLKPGEQYALQDAPTDMVRWFQNHRYLKVENLHEIEIGGVRGKEFDVVVSEKPAKLLPGYARPAIPLFPSAPRSVPFVVSEANKNRIITLNVEGETIIMIIESPPREFPEFLTRSKKILDTVKWGP